MRRWASQITAPLLAALCAAGCTPRRSLEETRRLLAAGELRSACAAARDLVDAEEDADARQLDALRTWIECLARSGRLAEAHRWVTHAAADEARQGPAARYARALILVSGSAAALPRALAELAAAARLRPRLAELRYRAGVLLLADEQPARALPLLERACALREGAACRVAQAHALLDLGRTEDALAAARRVPALRPNPAELRRGRALIQRIARRERRVPAAIDARYRRAVADLVRGDRAQQAADAAENLLLAHPDVPALHSLLGAAQLRLGQVTTAATTLARAAELDARDPRNHIYLGMIHEAAQRWVEAAKRYRRALRFDPFSRQATEGLARALHKAQRPQEAAAALARLVALAGDDPRDLRRSGLAHLSSGSPRTARAYFGRLLAESPDDFEGHLGLARALLALHAAGEGDADELLRAARRHVDRAAAARPDDPEVHQLRARLATAPR